MRAAASRMAWVAPGLMLLAALVWFGGGWRLAVTRELRFLIDTGESAGPWSVEWTRDQPVDQNGVWLDLQHNSGAVPLAIRLPCYPISKLELTRSQPVGAGARLVRPRVAIQFMGHVLVERPLVVAAITGAEAGTFEIPPGAAVGLELQGIPGATSAGNTLGVLVVFSGLSTILVIGTGCYGLVGAIGSVPARLTPSGRGLPRLGRLRLDIPAFALVVATHVWVAAWAPMLMCGDTPDYLVGAQQIVEHGRLGHLTGHRVPGYGIFLAPLWAVPWDFNLAVGIAQSIVGVGTAALAWEIARGLLPRPWPALVLLLVGTSPILLGWEHHAMSESLGAFMATLAIWVAARPGAWRREWGTARLFAYAALAGLVCAAGAHERGNLQLLVPVAAGLAGLAVWKSRGLILGATAAAVVCASAAGAMAPRVIQNRQMFGVPSFMVGIAILRLSGAWNHNVVDENQASVFDFEKFKDIARRHNSGMGSFEFIAEVSKVTTIPVPEQRKGRGANDVKLLYVFEESAARRPARRLVGAGMAFCNMLGLYTGFHMGEFDENSWHMTPLRGIGGTTARGTNAFVAPEVYTWLGEDGARALKRVVRDIGQVPQSTNARVFGGLWGVEQRLRPVYGVLVIAGLIAGLSRRHWAAAWLCGAVIMHAAVLAFLTGGGSDRYGVPVDPLLRIGAAYALWSLTAWLLNDRQSRPQAEAPPAPAGA